MKNLDLKVKEDEELLDLPRYVLYDSIDSKIICASEHLEIIRDELFRHLASTFCAQISDQTDKWEVERKKLEAIKAELREKDVPTIPNRSPIPIQTEGARPRGRPKKFPGSEAEAKKEE